MDAYEELMIRCSSEGFMPRTTSRPLSLALLTAALATACTGSVDSMTNLDASSSNVDADGQVARDGQINGNDGGRVDGGAISDTGVIDDLDAQTSDAQVSGSDATVANDGSVVVQPSGEPVFVAFGAGFWTATSCDRGRSWRLSQESSDREDHGPWSAFGRMAFGMGTFVGATGWGAPGHVLSSNTGLSFRSKLDLTAGTSGVGFTGTEFVLLTGDQVRRSPDGKGWGQGTFWNVLPGTNQIRYFRSFPELGVAIASVETQMGNPDRAQGLWTAYSTDGLRSWSPATGDFSVCAREIQGYGDIVAAGRTILMGAQGGNTCRSTDAGRTWQVSETVPALPLRDLWSDGQSFYALAAKAVYRLESGKWQPQGSLDIGDTSAAGATAGTTTVIASGAKFFWRDGSGPWTQASATATANVTGDPLASPAVRDMVVGHFAKACP